MLANISLQLSTYSLRMLEDPEVTSALGTALAKVLRPLVRLLLKHSFPYSAFENIAKRTFAECAMQDFAVPGRKPSASRASILTGLTRKEVNTLLSEPWDATRVSDSTHYNRAARVLTAWIREDQFAGIDSAPRPLPMEGDSGFNELVRIHGGDVPSRAVLDELTRVGAVEVRTDGLVHLIQRAFVPSKSMNDKLAILGADASDLIETITYNIGHTNPQALRYQRKVMHVGIPLEALPAFRALSSKQAQKLLEGLDSWLSNNDLSHLPGSEWPEKTARVGLGIYYFEQAIGEQEDAE